ncbi:MAG: ABC transporter ATP-binding protein [Tissierellia bacterium]|nr:ABC transporter ATP-binding protein [Tissierellia bacterium]
MSIKVENLSKVYGKKKALDGLTFTLEEGKFYGLLGKNGAGKTTFMKTLNGQILPSSGNIYINGKNIQDKNCDLGQIFYIGDDDIFLPKRKVKEYLSYLKLTKKEFDERKAREYFELFGLHDKMKFGKMSTGENTLLKVSIALSMNVPILVFDEPVLGLDPNHRELFYKCLLDVYMERQPTILLATHIMEEISQLVEEIVIIDQGKVLCQDSVEDLRQKGFSISGTKEKVELYVKGASHIQVLKREELGEYSIYYCFGEKKDRLKFLLERGVLKKDDVEFQPLPLQKLFIVLTNHEKEMPHGTYKIS